MATYFHSKPLLAAQKMKKETPVIETSENEAILESIRDGGNKKTALSRQNAITHCIKTKLGS